MPLDPVFAKAMLDWVTGAAAATQPTARWVSLATASPTSQSAFDGPFNSRMTWSPAPANSPQMSATNTTLVQNATATVAATVVGWNLWNSSAGGTRIAYGTATANIGCKSGDNVSLAAGAMIVVLS